MVIVARKRNGMGFLTGILLTAGILNTNLEARAESAIPGAAGWTNNAEIVHNWTTQNMVRASSVGNGNVSVIGVDAEGYVDYGSNVTLNATADLHNHFVFWTGIPSAYTNVQNPTFSVDAPYTNAKALFAIDQVTIIQSSVYSTPTWSSTNVNYGSTNALAIGTATNIVDLIPGATRVKRTGATIKGNSGIINP